MNLYPSSWRDIVEDQAFTPYPVDYLEVASNTAGVVSTRQGSLQSDQVVKWLAEPASSASHAEERTRFLIFGEKFNSDGVRRLPFSITTAKDLIEKVGFPPVFFHNYCHNSTRAAEYESYGSHCWVVHLHFCDIAIVRRDTTNLVLLSSRLDIDYVRPDNLTNRLIESKHLSGASPLWPIFTAVRCYAELMDRWTTQNYAGALQIYASHGIGRSTLFPNGRFTSSNQKDIDALSESMAVTLQRVSNVRNFHNCVQSLKLFHERLSECARDEAENSQEISRCAAERKHFDLELQNLASISESTTILVEKTEKMLNHELSLTQIKLTQKDTQVSLGLAQTSADIAVATNRDSSSMKVIAVLTTLFLPGTYIATLLSTPGYEDLIADKNVWLYWAITVPLTLCVMSALLVWMMFVRRTNVRQHVQAKEDALYIPDLNELWAKTKEDTQTARQT